MSGMSAAAGSAGNLRDLPLPEVLKSILASRGTGTLRMSRPGEEIRLFFESGELRTAISTAEGRRLGDSLLRDGIISEEAMDAAIRDFSSEGHGRLGKHLVDSGRITEEALESGTRKHFEEIALSAFSWPEGDFEFRVSGGRLDPIVAFPLSLPAVLMVGIRRIPESEKFVELLGDLDRYAAAVAASFEHYEALRLEPGEAYLLSLCDGKTKIRSILQLSPSRLAAARTLYALEFTGLVAMLDEPARAAETAEPRASAVWSESAAPDLDARARVARGDYLEARRLLERKDFYGAIVLLRECVRLAPENSEYHFRLARALAKNASWRTKAAEHYKVAFNLDPFREELMHDYAEFLEEEGDCRAAQTIVRRLVQKYPEDPRHRDLLAKCDEAVRVRDGDPAGDAGAGDSEKRSLFSRLWGRRSP